ncbi:hypothetical protein AGMMS50230_11000 [Spirochaetia bacterium]|nr:hypothetical protein AGMMS50230_11000 [Spirochaetia bacterium]
MDNAIEKGYIGDIIPYASGLLTVYDAGDFYLTDNTALQDPLRARLPALPPVQSTEIGHMTRDIPDGYRESIQTGKNKIADPYLHEYLDILWDITRSEKLFTRDRLQKIVSINLGGYDYLIDKYLENKKVENNANEEAQ